MAFNLARHGNHGRREPPPHHHLLPPVLKPGLGSSRSLPLLGQAPSRLQPLRLPELAGVKQLGYSPSLPEIPHANLRGNGTTAVRRSRAPPVEGRLGRLPTVAQLFQPRRSIVNVEGSGATELQPSAVYGRGSDEPQKARPSLLEVSVLYDLEQSAHEQNLSGPMALAFAFVAKCGSLENAWERFDLNRSGKVARWQWTNGLSRLHLDTERVCGVSSSKLFAQIATEPEMTFAAWTSFFQSFSEDPALASLLAEAVKQFESRRKRSSVLRSYNWQTQENQRSRSSKLTDRTPQNEAVGKTSAISSSLAEALEIEGRMSKDELQELELQASAERSQLQEELRDANLHGDQALAYILCAKFGSLQKAFRWFNANGSGRLSNNEWDTGIHVMRVDLQALTGAKSRAYFQKMERGKSVIRHSDWNAFFQSVLDSAPSGFDELLKRAAGSSQNGSLAERAQQKKEQLRRSHANSDWQTAAAQAVTATIGSDVAFDKKIESVPASIKDEPVLVENELAAPILAGLGKLSPEEVTFRDRIFAELSQLANDCSAEFSSDDIPDLNERKILIIQAVAAELGLFAHVLRGEHVWSDGSTEGDGVLVFNVGDFPQEARKQLCAIELHQSHAFPTSLSAAQRQVVHFLGSSLGLWTKSEGSGETRQVIAFNVGDFAETVREQLKVLKPGDNKIFSKDLSVHQRKIVHMIALELQLVSCSEGAGDERHVEVFNLASFAHEVRSELEKLGSGEQKTFDKSLGRQERKIVHCISDELNFAHVSEGVGDQRAITVGNLHDFRNWARSELEKVGLGETKAFPVTLSGLQRKIVHELATEFSMTSCSQGLASERFVSVSRLDESGSGSASAHNKVRRRRAGGSCDGGSESGDEESDSDDDKFERVFLDRATGEFKGVKLFTRADLERFREEFQELMPKKNRRRLPAVLHQLYEDSLQLQIDFGTRMKKGLDLRWFQVFIQKASSKLGFSAMGMLMTFLDEE